MFVLARVWGRIGSPNAPQVPANGGWQSLEEGLDFGDFAAPASSFLSDSRITVLRIDPSRFSLVLECASAMPDLRPRTAREWATEKGLVGAINASMYRGDHRTSVDLMKTAKHVNNSVLTVDKAVLAFDRLTASVPRVQIIDRDCQNFSQLQFLYGTLVQSIRMINCFQQNVWSEQSKKWSNAAIGIDKHGRVLFLFVRSPYSTHDFTDMLLSLPLDLFNAMYVEGGPEAQLYVNAGGMQIERFGSFETGFFESDTNSRAWPVPNVIGVVRFKQPR